MTQMAGSAMLDDLHGLTKARTEAFCTGIEKTRTLMAHHCGGTLLLRQSSISPIVSLGCYVRCPCGLSARHLSDIHMSRTAKSSANHLLRTARPTFIKARVPNQDCQIVPTPIMTQFRARWTTRDIVAANLPQRCNVLQYPEF